MMKHALIFLFALCTFSSTAQDYKPFKVNLSLGFAKPLSGPGSGGLLFSVEPKYSLSDNFDVGLRLESALLARQIEVNGNVATADIAGLSFAMLTGNYLFSTEGFRPFIGAGVGVFQISSSNDVTIVDGKTTTNITFNNATKLGAMVRAGVKTGHFVLSVEYNAVPTSKISQTTSQPVTLDTKNSYLGIKLGFDIGGGRR